MSTLIKVPVNIRRFDMSDNPNTEKITLELNTNLCFSDLKREVYASFDIPDEDTKVVKVRNKDLVLVPLMNLLTDIESEHTIDISKVVIPPSQTDMTQLQEAYLDAIKKKLNSLESRVTQAEVLLPHLQNKRQSHLDTTLNNLSTKVSFLNRRFDELTPPEWKVEALK